MLASLTLEYADHGSTLDRLKSLKEADFEAVNIGTPDCMHLLSSSLQETRKFRLDLQQNGLEVDWLHAPYAAIVLHDSRHKLYPLSMGAIKSAIITASELDAGSLIVHPFGPSYPDDVSAEESLKQLAESFSVFVDYGRPLGVKIAVENINEPHSTRILSHLLESVEQLHLCFDIGHAALYKTREWYIPKYIDRISALHVHDNNGQSDEHLIPGDGSIDLLELVEQLRIGNYNGYFGLECVQKIAKYSGNHSELAKQIKQRIDELIAVPAN